MRGKDENMQPSDAQKFREKLKLLLELAKKKKSLARSLECEIPQEIYDQLMEMFKEDA